MRAWAQWFAIFSGTIYLPLEVYALIQHTTALKALVLLSNLGIAGYVAYFRLASRAGRQGS